MHSPSCYATSYIRFFTATQTHFAVWRLLLHTGRVLGPGIQLRVRCVTGGSVAMVASASLGFLRDTLRLFVRQVRYSSTVQAVRDRSPEWIVF
jgi:hypothetical protein